MGPKRDKKSSSAGAEIPDVVFDDNWEKPETKVNVNGLTHPCRV